MRATLRMAAALAVLALALAACGGSGHATTGGTASQPPTAAQVAAQIGATGVQEVNPPTLYAYTEAHATWQGRTVDIVTFRTAKLQASWEQVAGQFTGIVKHGDLYTITDG